MLDKNVLDSVMKISVKVKSNAKTNSVEKISEREFVVRTKNPPHEGRANEGVVAVLAKYFAVPKSSVRIIAGLFSRKKIIEIGVR